MEIKKRSANINYSYVKNSFVLLPTLKKHTQTSTINH